MLFAKVVLALMLGRPAERYLDAQRAAHVQRMRELTRLKDAGSLVDALLADHGLFHLEADLRWIDLTCGPAQRTRGNGGNPMNIQHRAPCLIEARDVTKSFGQTPALRGASVAVRQGEILAIMGPSGSGKSTLLHCLAGIFTPDSGEVWFDGQRLDTFNEAERTRLRRTTFGFVFQFGQLVPELTTADNIALPLLLNRTGRKAAYAQAGAVAGPAGPGR